jgi:2-C-methyl-D-erythritol 4-phosphate cytidylyltransferase
MYAALIVAAGSGRRMHASRNKMFIPVHGLPLIRHTVNVFAADDDCDEIVVVCRAGERADMREALEGVSCNVVPGGATRQDSVRMGLSSVHGDIVMIHDGARPCLDEASLERLKNVLDNHAAAALAVTPKDTVSMIKDGVFTQRLDRDAARLMQTPQAFVTDAIRDAHNRAKREHASFTDDVSLFMAYSQKKVFAVEGNYDNIKVTDPSDLKHVEELL